MICDSKTPGLRPSRGNGSWYPSRKLFKERHSLPEFSLEPCQAGRRSSRYTGMLLGEVEIGHAIRYVGYMLVTSYQSRRSTSDQVLPAWTSDEESFK